MKKIILLGFVLITALIAVGCEDTPPDPIAVDEASEEKQFVWEGLNYWYLWQEEIPELGDTYFETDQAYKEYLSGFSDARALFDELLYSEDRFSWFIEDYEQQEQAFKGISKAFGFSFGLVGIGNSTDLFGYVQYVLPGSPAEEAGLERGDLFTQVNGTTLTDSNYQDLLASDHYELTMAGIENNTISETGSTITMDAIVLQENPVFMAKVIDTAGVKVGYLVYNAFRYNYHEELNNAFGELASQGVDELVLDLRYNGGGALITSATLAGMISGLDESSDFANLMFNEKRAEENNTTYPILSEVPLYDDEGELETNIPMNTLSLDHIYVLTGFSTASASEALINGLKPYIDVTLIGEQTYAKDVGSITVYDSPPDYTLQDSTDEENLNPNHTIAMQPIVLKLTNSEEQDYPDGFAPEGYDPNLNEGRGGCPVGVTTDNCVDEVNFLEDMPPLGDPAEPLLARALALITGQPLLRLQIQVQQPQRHVVADSRDLKPFGKDMYLIPGHTEAPAF